MAHRIIPRSEWGARHQGGFYDRPVGNLRRYLHHSVTLAPDLVPPFTDDYAAVRELESIGQSRFKGGISYTFVISPAGLIFEGHGIGRIGSHTAGYNTIAAGICLIGNYEKSKPTTQQLAALDWLLHEGVRRRWWTSPTLTGGHRDTKSTACPGRNAYAIIPAVNAGKYHDVTTTPIQEVPDMDATQAKQLSDIHAALPKLAQLWEGIAPGIPTSATKDPEKITLRAAVRDIRIAVTRQMDDAVAQGVAVALKDVSGVDKAALTAGVVAEVRKVLDAVGDTEYILTPKEN